MEYARPSDPMKIPLVFSILLFLNWLMLRDKHWNPQVICFLLLLCVIAVMGPFATNSYAIWWGFRNMTVQLLFICIPLIHCLSSMRKFSIFVNVLISVYVYLAIFGFFHAGTGPGGHVGDENDLALAINTAIPFAFFSILLAKRPAQKVLFGCAFGLMVASVVTTFSRGGSVGLAAVLLYCFLSVPRKASYFVIGFFLVIGAWMYVPQSYWNEIASIQDTATATKESNMREGRLDYWEVARKMFYANPILGVGLNNFSHNAGIYQSEEQKERLQKSIAGQSVHSFYFKVLAELGTLGVLIVGAMILYNFRDINYIIKNAKKQYRFAPLHKGSIHTIVDETLLYDLNRTRYYAHAIRASMLGFLSSGIFLSVFTYPHIWLLTALTVTLKVALTERLKNATEV